MRPGRAALGLDYQAILEDIAGEVAPLVGTQALELFTTKTGISIF